MKTKNQIIAEVVAKNPSLYKEENLKRLLKCDLLKMLEIDPSNDYSNTEPNQHPLVAELEQKFPIEGLRIPERNPNFHLSDETKDLFSLIYNNGLVPGSEANVLLKGPQGCGKTESVREFAATYNLPLLNINCSLVREARDWFGYKTAENGNVRWIRSQFAKAVERGGVVVCLDELTRANPIVLNALMNLFDSSRSTFIEETKTVLEVGPLVYFFATANFGSAFTGTHGKLDAALDDRFSIIMEVDFLPEDKEIEILMSSTGIEKVIAEKFVKVANTIRRELKNNSGGKVKKAISTRCLLNQARLYKILGTKSFDFGLLSRFEDSGADGERAFVSQTIQAQFGASRA